MCSNCIWRIESTRYNQTLSYETLLEINVIYITVLVNNLSSLLTKRLSMYNVYCIYIQNNNTCICNLISTLVQWYIWWYSDVTAQYSHSWLASLVEVMCFWHTSCLIPSRFCTRLSYLTRLSPVQMAGLLWLHITSMAYT